MTNLATIEPNALNSVTGGAAQPSAAGTLCRSAITGASAVAGGFATSSLGGWGAFPAALAGNAAGTAVCPR